MHASIYPFMTYSFRYIYRAIIFNPITRIYTAQLKYENKNLNLTYHIPTQNISYRIQAHSHTFSHFVYFIFLLLCCALAGVVDISTQKISFFFIFLSLTRCCAFRLCVWNMWRLASQRFNAYRLWKWCSARRFGTQSLCRYSLVGELCIHMCTHVEMWHVFAAV